jgi:flavin-dependent dehydrogenase
LGEQADVVVVGARCAGSPLATLLARSGARVVVLERASFPRETLSSHLFEVDALDFLHRLGALERLLETGAPLVELTDTRVEDLRLQMALPQRPGDVGAMMSVRRQLLDPILAELAAQAGADVRMGAQVSGVIEDRGRVVGVRYSHGGSEHELRAPLVVGADGRHSTLARLVGARRYNVTPSQRLLFWAYFEGADAGQPTFLSHRWGERFILGIPSDSGLYQVLLWPEAHERERFQRDRDGAFLEHARACEPLADSLTGARQVGRAIGVFRWEGHFREACGPGWVLCGDAGHFKSPAPGRGIGDAFLQAERLAQAIGAALGGGEQQLDRAMGEWGRWREHEFAEHYWLAYDLEEAGTVPPVLVEFLRRLHQQGRAGEFFDVLNHRARPSQVLTPPRMLAASMRLLARRGRARALAQVGALGVRDARRRRMSAHPVFAAEGEPTDVAQGVMAGAAVGQPAGAAEGESAGAAEGESAGERELGALE